MCAGALGHILYKSKAVHRAYPQQTQAPVTGQCQVFCLPAEVQGAGLMLRCEHGGVEREAKDAPC